MLARRNPIGAVAAALIVGVVLVGAVALRPLVGGQPAVTGPISATTIDGPFELTIRSEHGLYAASDPVNVNASLTYRGPGPQVKVAHGFGGPLGFGIVEPVHGLQLAPGWRASCNLSVLSKDVPVDGAFGKSGGFSGDNPDASAVAAFFADPVLRLPPGTWHIYAVAYFEIDQCAIDAQKYQMRVQVTIVVPAPDGSIPTAPAPTPTTNPLDLGAGDDTQDGAIQLTLTSPHGRYKAGDPIEVLAGLTNRGSGASITTTGGPDGPVIFSVRQVDGPVVIEPTVLQSCIEQVTLPAYQPMQIPFKKLGTVAGGAADPEYWQAWFADPILRLPVGTWEISATPNFTLGGCGSKTSPDLRPTITLVVTP
jgi:hypothetical protein